MLALADRVPTRHSIDPKKENLAGQIQSRAYQIHIERRDANGSAIEDRLQAERELRESIATVREQPGH
jgi:hypothetical protein